MIRLLRSVSLSAMAAVLLAGALPAAAQIGGLGANAGNSPLEVTARNGIEWDRANLRYIARGDTRVVTNGNIIEGDELVAYYRQKPNGDSDIFRLDVTGNARITTKTQKVSGDRAIYDSDSGVLVITGKTVKLNTATEEVVAHDSLEYWEAKRLAVARGNATLVTAERRIRADVLTGYFSADTAAAKPVAKAPPPKPPARGKAPPKPAAKPAPAPTPAAATDSVIGGQQNIERVEAFGGVVVATKNDIVRGDRAVYNAATGIATVAGNVRITQSGTQQATGDYAEFDMKTGQSRLLAKPGQGGDGRVRLLLTPGQAGAGTTPSAPGAPAKR